MSDISGNEDIPEYRYITDENMYEFMIWANERRDKSISVDHFNMIIQANISDWIEKNNITWQFGVTLAIDTIKNQGDIDSHFDISLNEVDVTDDMDGNVTSEYEYVSEEEENVEEKVEENVEENVEETEELYEKRIRPTSLEERRRLFASAAEKRSRKF